MNNLNVWNIIGVHAQTSFKLFFVIRSNKNEDRWVVKKIRLKYQSFPIETTKHKETTFSQKSKNYFFWQWSDNANIR